MQYFLLVKLFAFGTVMEWVIPLPEDAQFPSCAPYMQVEHIRLKNEYPQFSHALRCVRVIDVDALNATG
jgi:hypothetical protein